MGNTICKKCGVDHKYYNGRDPGNSCQIHDYKENCPCGNRGNCFHRFEYKFFGNLIKKKYKNNINKNYNYNNDKKNNNETLNFLLSKYIKTK